MDQSRSIRSRSRRRSRQLARPKPSQAQKPGSRPTPPGFLLWLSVSPASADANAGDSGRSDSSLTICAICGRSSMEEHVVAGDNTRVRFPPSAPIHSACACACTRVRCGLDSPPSFNGKDSVLRTRQWTFDSSRRHQFFLSGSRMTADSRSRSSGRNASVRWAAVRRWFPGQRLQEAVFRV